MKFKATFLLILLSISLISAQESDYQNLLSSYVSDEGFVDYKGLKNEEAKLDVYLSYLQNTSAENSWSDNRKKAFWINAYNAYTLKLILDHYPLKSITSISIKGNTAWKSPIAKVGGKVYTLDQIEHDILRKTLFDPRIHVGVNCASISCPKLSNKAFTEDNIDTELDRLMTEFINHATNNLYAKKHIEISQLFNWYKDDFKKKGSIIDYINGYAKTPVKANAKIRYLEYNWNLSGK